MKKIAFLFPGQGSQAVGMGGDAAERLPGGRGIFSRADAALGYGLEKLCLEGPEEELKKTENTQPALYLTSAITLEVLRTAGLEPWAVAGHSLGEYTALHAAGVFDFETGLALVRQRGLAFAEAGQKEAGGMAAIIGLDAEKVAVVCEEAAIGGGVCVPANLNEPMQTVISGTPETVDRACEIAKAQGAKRALRLPVSGAFHSPLVASAGDVMRDALSKVELTAPKAIFVNNVDATVLDDPKLISDSLVRQVTGAVRWYESVEKLMALGVEAFVEVGSGKVLSGLARRVAREVPCYTTESAASIDKTLSELT